MSGLWKWLCFFSVACVCGSASGLEHRIDSPKVSQIRSLIGASAAGGLIAVTFSETGNITTHLDPDALAPGDMTSAYGDVTNFSFSFSRDFRHLTATFNGYSVGQDLPVVAAVEATGNPGEGVYDISPAVALQVKTLLEVSGEDALLVLEVGASGFGVYKSAAEFNQPGGVASVGSLIAGAAVLPLQAVEGGQEAGTDGCTTYYVTIGGYTYTYVVCD